MIEAQETQPITENLEDDPQVSHALSCLQSLGVISASSALRDEWGVVVIPTTRYSGGAVRLYPWTGRNLVVDRPDSAHFDISTYIGLGTKVYLKRDLKQGTDHITIASEMAETGALPRFWSGITGYTQENGSFGMDLGADGRVTRVSFYDDGNYISTLLEHDGESAVEQAFQYMGGIVLGLNPDEMPRGTTFNPGLLVNAVLDHEIPFVMSDMFQQARDLSV